LDTVVNVLPVIKREVREQARQSFTYSLRMLGVAAVLAACLWAVSRSGLLPGNGGQIFTWIHVALLLAIWLLVPLSASDCLSRERRDGTLGLLFLTPLSARDIVFAKAAAQGLRALTLWLASVPVVAIPFLIGGLTWQILALACVIHFCCIALALGASLLASSLCRMRQRALAVTLLLGFMLAISYAVALLITVVGMVAANLGGFTPLRFFQENRPSVEDLLAGGFIMLTGAGEAWTRTSGFLSPRNQRDALLAIGVVAVFTILFAGLLLLIASRNARRRWQEHTRSARTEKLERVFCTPMMGRDLLHRWMRWKLEHNPIGWLEQRKWSGRLVMWSWVAVLVSFYSMVFSSRGFFIRGFPDLQATLAWLLLVSVAATAAGSFRRERETGVLELLLVSPLNTRKIIGGRVRGIWGQFAPAVLLLVLVWMFAATFMQSVRAEEVLWFSIGFLTLPIVGLYYSLAKTHFLSAFLWTMLVGYGFPTLLSNSVGWRLRAIQMAGPATPGSLGDPAIWRGPIWAMSQLALAVGFAWLLHRNLEQRRFALERPTG
jgi:ABC-type transport system involved in multi-copper enzyme maturation permease subunit